MINYGRVRVSVTIGLSLCYDKTFLFHMVIVCDWMSETIRLHSLHGFIPIHSPVNPCLFAIQSTLSCASAWEFSVLSFEQLAVSSAPNVPNSTATHKNYKHWEITAFHTVQFSTFVSFKRKYFCSHFETNIQSVKIYLLVAFTECDTSSRGNVVVWRNEGTVLCSSPNGSKRNFFD